MTDLKGCVSSAARSFRPAKKYGGSIRKLLVSCGFCGQLPITLERCQKVQAKCACGHHSCIAMWPFAREIEAIMMIEEVQLLQIIAVFSTRFECVSVESNTSNLTKSMKVLVTHEEKCKMQKKVLAFCVLNATVIYFSK